MSSQPQSSPPKSKSQVLQHSTPVNYSTVSPSRKDQSLLSPCRLQDDVFESSQLLAQIKLANIKIKDLEHRIDSLKIENEALQHQLSNNHDEVQNAKTIHYQFNTKENDYKQQLDEAHHEIANLIEENEHLTALNKDLQMELETKTSHFESIRDGLEKELNQAKKKLDFEKSHGENKRKVEQQYLQNQVEQLKQQNTELQRKSMMDSKISNSSSVYSFSNDEYIMGLLAGKRRDEIEKLQKEKEQFDVIVGDLKQKVDVLHQKNEELSKIVEVQNEQIEEQMSEIELLKFEHKDKKEKQKYDHGNQVKELKEQYEQHIKELNQQIEDDRKEFDKQIDQAIEGETKKLKQELKQEKKKVKDLQEKLDGIHDEHNEKHQSLKQEHLEHFDNLHEVIENLEQQMQNQKEQYEGQIMHLNYKLQMYEHKNTEKTKQYLGDISNKAKSSNTFEIPRGGDNNYKLQYMKQTIDDLLAQIRNKEDIIRRYEIKIGDFQKEKDYERQSLELEHAQRRKDMENQHKQEIDNHIVNNEIIRKTNEEEINQLSFQNQKLTNQLGKQKKDIKAFEDQIANLLKKNEDLNRQLREQKYKQSQISEVSSSFSSSYSSQYRSPTSQNKYKI